MLDEQTNLPLNTNHLADLSTPSTNDGHHRSSSFDASWCLFCRHHGTSTDAVLIHMRKHHGLFIEHQEKLLVDVEVLLAYLHLVINDYQECISCGTQRRSAEAVRQHMISKAHCKFDISAAESEYRDFYDLESDGEGDEVREQRMRRKLELGQLGDARSCFPDARRAKPRQSAPAMTRNASADDSNDARYQSTNHETASRGASTGANTSNVVLTRAEKRGFDPTSQVMRMRGGDRASLINIPSAQQRAILATHQKQVASMQREDRKARIRVERSGNKTLMKHFYMKDADSRTLYA